MAKASETGVNRVGVGGANLALTIGLVTMITLAAFEALATNTVMPAVEDELQNVTLYGWVFSGFLLASLIGITFAGEQSDRVGPARPYAIGLVLFAIGLFIAGVATSMEMLVVGRVVQGLGAGALPPVAYVAVARVYPEHARARMFALFSTAWVVPGLVGPALAGAVAEYLHWRVVFLGILPLIIATSFLTLPALGRIGPPAEPQKHASRVPMAVLVAVGAGFVLGALTLRSPLYSPPLGAVGLVAMVISLRRLMPKGTLRAAYGLPAAIVGVGAVNFAFFAADAFIPYMLTEIRGTTTVVAGLVITSATLSWTGGAWVTERTANRFERRTLVRVGMLLLCIGIAGLVPVLSEAFPVWWAVGAWIVGGFGIGIAYPNFSLITLAEAPPAEVGTVSSALKLSEAMSAAVGAGTVGAIVAAGAGGSGNWPEISIAVAFGVAAAVALGGLALAARLPANAVGEEAETPEAVAVAGK